jgi:ribosomal protein S18 acetylase RimI-like enzyme
MRREGAGEHARTAVTIRAATADDVDGVLALWSTARSANASTPDTKEAVNTLLKTSPDALLVAEHATDGIVGAIVAGWDGWRGNMYRLAVAPTHRRRGIALALVDAAERHLTTRGARRITALVAHEELEAVGLWTRAGYLRDTTIARFVKSLRD